MSHNNVNSLFVSRTHLDAKLPKIKTSGSAGYDLYTIEAGVINAQSHALVRTGIIVRIPDGYCGQIWPRSGLSFKNGIETGAGVIDSDYKSELGVILHNHSKVPFEYKKHMRIAQLLVIPIITPSVVEYFDESQHKQLCRSSNRKGGFGSTGLY